MPETKKRRGANNEYEVGYKRPPKHTQFKKGQSGNARGRPKKKPQMPDVGVSLASALNEKVAVNVNGRVCQMTKLDLILGQAVNKAAAGHLGHLRALMPVAEKYSDAARASAGEQQIPTSPEDREKELDRLFAALLTKSRKKQSDDPEA